MPKSLFVVVPALAVLWAATVPVASSQAPQQPLRARDSKPAAPRGKKTFASTCASCHGLDARGSERAPNIADSAKAQRLSNAQIAHLIENGIPGTGMPAFHSLQDSDIQALVLYLRTLQGAKNQGTKKTIDLPGNPARGETVFFGKAGCSTCHMAAGKGGFIASDLSAYGGTHAVDQIRSAITNPAPNTGQQARLVTATTRGGEKVLGRIRNEDNFSLQLQALDGTFHFVAKSDLDGLEYNSQPMMPTDYGSTLSSDELNHVVSYLMSVAHTRESATPKKVEEEE